MKKKRRTSLYSQKSIAKTALTLISLLLMLCTAWIAENPHDYTAPSSGEVSKFFSNQTGDDLETVYTAAIQKAKKSIVLMIFSITNENVIQALRQKSEEGLSVKVVCDAKACPYIQQKLGPKVEIVRRFSKGLMHLKILAIDEEESWVGSANLTGESLNMHGNLVIALHDPTLTKTIIEKAASLKEYERETEFPPKHFFIAHQKVELSFLPDDKNGSIRLKDLIRAAKKTIRVAMYTWTRFDLAKEIIDAKKRGVDVEVVLDKSSSKGASSKIAELLNKEGIPLSLSTGNALLHHKFMWVDENILEVGSANWTKAAFTQNDDCFLILHELTEDQKNHMRRLWKVIKAESASR